MHGINRSFDDNQGPVRRIFWAIWFLASFWFLWLFVARLVEGYLVAEVKTMIYQEEGSSALPMITICNYSPVRCDCEVR